MSDRAAVALFVFLFFVAVAVAVWVRFLAPCGAIDWLPINELPARCVMWVKP